MKQELSIPICIIHAVRNPFDIISTTLDYMKLHINKYRDVKLAMASSSTQVPKLNISDAQLKAKAHSFFRLVDGVVEMIDLFGRENVLEVHNCELVDDPRGTMSRVFQFLGVDTSDHVLDVCAAKVFKSVSRSRDTIVWKPEWIKEVDKRMRKYKMFNRYSFISD